jgi:hypothetical protein
LKRLVLVSLDHVSRSGHSSRSRRCHECNGSNEQEHKSWLRDHGHAVLMFDDSRCCLMLLDRLAVKRSKVVFMFEYAGSFLGSWSDQKSRGVQSCQARFICPDIAKVTCLQIGPTVIGTSPSPRGLSTSRPSPQRSCAKSVLPFPLPTNN